MPSPGWLPDAIVYEVGPWEYSRFGSGRAFNGIAGKLPELETLGVNLLYLLPLWENTGWYNISDHFTLFRKYGTEQELRALVAEAHRRGMRVILDLAGTIGVPLESKLLGEHPDWFILGGDNKLYRSWTVDGYRCDMAMALPYALFEKIRQAIQQLKPEAILIAEGSTPIDHETAFDVTYDFPFLERIFCAASHRTILPASCGLEINSD